MLSILLYAMTTIVIVYIILDLTWRIWTRKYSFLLSPPNVPWLGIVPYIGSSPHEIYNMFTSFFTKYNHLYVLWFGPWPSIFLGCVEWIEPVLKSQDLKKSYDLSSDWLGTGLLLSTGTKWKKRRTALTRAFHFAVLKDFVDIFERNAKNLIKKFETFAIKNEAVDVQSPFCLATLDVICETSMGVKINALESAESPYSKAIHEIKVAIIKQSTNLWPKFIFQFTSTGKAFYKNLNIVHNFTIDVINKKIASRSNVYPDDDINDVNQSNMNGKKVFLDILLDLYDEGEIDVDGIREEVDTFMFAGHDTTSTTLSWTLYEIGRNEDIQQKLHDEIDSVSSQQCSLMEKIRLLRYLENVIKESLRLYSPVPAVFRMLEKDMVIGKNIVPSGTEMAVDIHSVHMNHKYWDEPNVFNPDRFESEDFLKRNPFCYIPFSAGPRNCIGQKFAMLEAKVFLYFILSKFKIKSVQTLDDLEICSEIITYSGNGINIEFFCRTV